MADTNPPVPPGGPAAPKPSESAKIQPKKETVRISLPPKPTAAPTIKIPKPAGPTPAVAAAAAPATAPAAAPAAAPATPSAQVAAPAAPAARPVAAPAAAVVAAPRAPTAPAPRSVAAPAAAAPTRLDTVLAVLAIVAVAAGLVRVILLGFGGGGAGM